MLIFRGARLLDPATQRDEIADLAIDAGRIVAVTQELRQAAERGKVELIEAAGCWLVPGFIDLHAHLREPGDEHKEDLASGLRAAAAGGFTTVCCMANTRPVNDSAAITELLLCKSRALGGARLLPFGAVTCGLQGKELSEMAALRQAGAIGVSDDGRCIMDAALMRHALEYASDFDLLLSQHAEDHQLTAGAQMHEGEISTRLGLRGWPREAEDIIVARDLILAEATGARYHVAHVSSLGAVRLLREAKGRGLPVSAEVTPHHLLLTDEAVLGYRTDCKVNPPLRSAEDRQALREALRDGTLDCIATDHAPHGAADKDCDFESAAVGINGLETALPALLGLVRSEDLTPLRLIEALSTSPARLLRDGERGTLRLGAIADLTLIDPQRRWTLERSTLHTRSLNTPWLGQEMLGRVAMTFVGGLRCALP